MDLLTRIRHTISLELFNTMNKPAYRLIMKIKSRFAILHGLKSASFTESQHWHTSRHSFNGRYTWEQKSFRSRIVALHLFVAHTSEKLYRVSSKFLEPLLFFSARTDNNKFFLKLVTCLDSKVNPLISNEASNHKIIIVGHLSDWIFIDSSTWIDRGEISSIVLFYSTTNEI